MTRLASISRRTLALWFPELPLDRWRRRDDPRLWGPFVVSARSGNAERVLCADAHARASGVHVGQTLTDAQAISPNLLSEPQDTAREAKLLAALRLWADRFSPRIAVEPPDTLLLDITGCAHLFGGERDLAELIEEEAKALKMTPRIGVANTRRAASGFARQGRTSVTITNPESEHSEVTALTVSALNLEARITDDLRRLGIKTIGDLARFKSSELARRFSVRLPEALDELRGHRAHALVPKAAPPTFAARMTLPDPIARVEGVMAIVERLAERVCARLHEKGYAARGFALTVRCVDTGDHERSIGFATPSRNVKPILRQFQKPVETIVLEFGADQFRLVALHTEIFRHTQIKAGDAMEANKDVVDQTLTTLGNRLGFDRLRRPVAGAGHTPEREAAFTQVVDGPSLDASRGPANDLVNYPRPEIVFPPQYLRIEEGGHPPRAFAWRGTTYRTQSAKGRERISPVPWDEPCNMFEAQTRDYWRVRTDSGRLFWLMTFAKREDPNWFICGEFLREPSLKLILA